MLDKIIEYDQNLLIYLNQLGSPTLDGLMMYTTHQINWWPFFLFIIYLLLKKIHWKTFIALLIVLTLFFVFTDQVTNLFKNGFERLRPVNNQELIPHLRILRGSASYSFFSGHASNSSGAILILYLILKKYYKYAALLFLFPLFFAYTRIYLALHFPIDIIVGYIFGLLSGYTFYYLYRWVIFKMKLQESLSPFQKEKTTHIPNR